MIPNIKTRSGGFFHFLQPDPESIHIEDIAEGLAKCCRYAGQCIGFHSVAEHSVKVSLVVPREYALQALLHDGSEAYMGDMTTPLKQLIPDYKVIERRVQAAIYTRFGLPEEEDLIVKAADYQMFITESRLIMQDHPTAEDPTWDVDWSIPSFPGVKAAEWDWEKARQAFLTRYYELTK